MIFSTSNITLLFITPYITIKQKDTPNKISSNTTMWKREAGGGDGRKMRVIKMKSHYINVPPRFCKRSSIAGHTFPAAKVQKQKLTLR